MIRFTGRHMSGQGHRHEYIQSLDWIDPSDNGTGTSDVRPTLVDWVNSHPAGSAYVQDDKDNRVSVGVVDASPAYLRTYADGVWTDNLLSLPAR